MAGGGLAGGGAATAVARSYCSKTNNEARVSAAESPEKRAMSRAWRGPRLTRAWAAAWGREGLVEKKRKTEKVRKRLRSSFLFF